MFDVQLPEAAHSFLNDALVWVGFGTVVGLLAKAVMPGRDPGGAVATLLMGIGGTVIGCAALSYFWEGQRVTPISLGGFVVATLGALFLLFFYRLLGGRIIREGDRATHALPPRRRRAGRRYDTVYED